MNAFQISNPDITKEALVELFKKMPLSEFLETSNDLILRGEAFAKSDDSSFSSSLDEGNATLYAYYCKQFNEALRELKKLPRSKIALYSLARTIAWWQTINTFRIFYGNETPSERS
jgi:hypothetical protein